MVGWGEMKGGGAFLSPGFCAQFAKRDRVLIRSNVDRLLLHGGVLDYAVIRNVEEVGRR